MFEPGSSSDTNNRQRDSHSSIVRSGVVMGSGDEPSAERAGAVSGPVASARWPSGSGNIEACAARDA